MKGDKTVIHRRRKARLGNSQQPVIPVTTACPLLDAGNQANNVIPATAGI